MDAPARPGKVTAISIMTLVGGIYGVTIGLALAVVVSATLAACGGDGNGITFIGTVAVVEVTSPIGSSMALGRAVQLSATAKDRNDNPVSGVQFTWGSSNTAVATVTSSGLVESVAEGSVTITATAEDVPGNLQMRVVAADLGGISSVLSDPFAAALVSNLTAAAQSNMQATMSECSSNVSSRWLSGWMRRWGPGADRPCGDPGRWRWYRLPTAIGDRYRVRVREDGAVVGSWRR